MKTKVIVLILLILFVFAVYGAMWYQARQEAQEFNAQLATIMATHR